MFRKSELLMALLLLSSVLYMTRIQTTEAADTIYIRADGSIEPQTAPISSVDNVTYTFTDNINTTIVIERSNIVVDGAEYMVYGTGTGNGIFLQSVSNVTIENAVVTSFYYGIYFVSVSNSRILENTVTSNSYDGIYLSNSTQNTIEGNSIVSNGNDGIKLVQESNSNTVSENIVTANNDDGIQIDRSTYNSIIGNNLTMNVKAGINTGYSSHELIRANKATGNQYGIRLVNTTVEDVQMNNIYGNSMCGIWLDYSSNDTISGNDIVNNYDGFYVHTSSRNEISENSIAANSHYGIGFSFSSNNRIVGNNVTESSQGIRLVQFSDSNIIYENIIANDTDGIWLSGSSANNIQANNIVNNNKGISLLFNSQNSRLYHNNFVNNTSQASVSSFNYWDNGIEGNYWSDYTPQDWDNDGIGLAHLVNVSNIDRFPLLGTFSSFKAMLSNQVNVISNSTILDFQSSKSPGNITIRIFVSNTTSTQIVGFGRICIPHSLMTEPFDVTINGTTPSYANFTIFDNSTHRWIYFSYGHSIQEIVVKGTDDVPPTINILSPENRTYATDSMPLEFKVSETTSWIGYSLDGQMNQTIAGNTTLLGLSEGSHTLAMYANDTVGNMGASAVQFFVDTTVPIIQILSPENRTYATDSMPLEFKVSETTSWIGYSLDGQMNQTIAGNTTLLGLSEGSHTLAMYANDTVGNMGASAVQFFVDTIAPSITILSPENRTYATNSIPLEFTLNEPLSWIGYSLDAQANTTITGNTTLSSLADGHHTIIVYGNDSIGNMRASNLVYFTVDSTPPSIASVNQSPLTGYVTPDDKVKVNVTVTDSLSGVKNVYLNYTTDNQIWALASMTNLAGNVWNGTIQAFPEGTDVTYVIIAQDNADNILVTGGFGYHSSYEIIPEFSTLAIILTLAMASVLIAEAERRRKRSTQSPFFHN